MILLIILDPNVLHLYENVVLDDYGYYLVYPEQALEQPAVRAFRDWIVGEAKTG